MRTGLSGAISMRTEAPATGTPTSSVTRPWTIIASLGLYEALLMDAETRSWVSGRRENELESVSGAARSGAANVTLSPCAPGAAGRKRSPVPIPSPPSVSEAAAAPSKSRVTPTPDIG